MWGLINKQSVRLGKNKKPPLANVNGLRKAYQFRAGDILSVVYWAKNNASIFNGVCMGIRGKFMNPNLSFMLRNVIIGVGIEMVFSYFYSRMFKIQLEFYKKKHHFLRRSRAFFIRNRINRQSRVN